MPTSPKCLLPRYIILQVFSREEDLVVDGTCSPNEKHSEKFF
jgi:hypothetical protein